MTGGTVAAGSLSVAGASVPVSGGPWTIPAYAGASMLIGASSTDWPSYVTHIGMPQIIRAYDDAFTSTVAAGLVGQVPSGDLKGIPIVYSCKPSPGQSTASFTSLFASTPLGSDGKPLTMIFSMQHEASNPAKAFTTAAEQAQLKSDWIRFANAAHAAGFKTAWIEMDFTWQKSSNRVPENWYPGDQYIDYVCVDAYNNGSINSPQRWDSVGYSVGAPVAGENLSHVGGGYVEGGFMAWAQSKVAAGSITGWMVTEWATVRQQTVGAQTKAAYMTSGADYWAAQGCSAITFFDDDISGRTSAVTGEHWGFEAPNTPADSSDCFAAWASVASKY